jgi:hypothetical protein
MGQVVPVGSVLRDDPDVEHDPELERDDGQRFDEHHEHHDFNRHILDFYLHDAIDHVQPYLANDDENELEHEPDSIIHLDGAVHIHAFLDVEDRHQIEPDHDEDLGRLDGAVASGPEPQPRAIFVCVAGCGADWGAEFLYR